MPKNDYALYFFKTVFFIFEMHSLFHGETWQHVCFLASTLPCESRREAKGREVKSHIIYHWLDVKKMRATQHFDRPLVVDCCTGEKDPSLPQ